VCGVYLSEPEIEIVDQSRLSTLCSASVGVARTMCSGTASAPMVEPARNARPMTSRKTESMVASTEFDLGRNRLF